MRVWSWIRKLFGVYINPKHPLKHLPKISSFSSGLGWGRYHPKSPHQWWGGIEPSYNLTSKLDIRDFDGFLVPFRADVIKSKETFGYGVYEALITLYPSEWDWMSFWLYSEDGVGEIDIFEFYTDPLAGEEWFDTTIHYGDYNDSSHKRTRAIRSYIPRPLGKPLYFRLEWFRDGISIYYGGALARRITDERVLSELWGKKMNVIFQCGVMPEKAQMGSFSESWMEVKAFKYTEREK